MPECQHLQRHYEAMCSIHGPLSAHSLTALHELATCYLQTNEGRKAEASFKNAWKRRQKVLGDTDLDTLASQHYLALCCRKNGNQETAKVHAEHAWTHRCNTLGAAHADTIASHYLFATCIEACGDPLEASAHYERLLSLEQKVDAHTLKLHHRMGRCCHATGQLTRARRHFSRAFEGRSAINAPDTLDTLICLVECLIDLNDPDTSELRSRLDQLRGMSDESTPIKKMSILSALARGYERAGQTGEEVLCLENLWILHRRYLSDAHPRTLRSRLALAVRLVEIDDAATARPHLDALHESDDPRFSLAARRHIVKDLFEQRQSWQYIRMLEELLDHQRRILATYDLDTLPTLFDLAKSSRDKVHILQFIEAVSDAQLRNDQWAEFAFESLKLAAPLIRAADLPDWPRLCAKISRAFRADLDLISPEGERRQDNFFAATHALWLGLCADLRHHDVPTVLSTLHGRELLSLIVEESKARNATELLPSDPRRMYFEVTVALRRLRAQITSLPKQQTSAANTNHRGTESDKEQLLAKYAELIRERDEARKVLFDSHPDYLSTQQYSDLDVKTLSARLPADAVLVLLFSSKNDDAVSGWACVICDGHADVLPLPELQGVVRLLAQHRDGAEASDRLERALWVPLQEKLRGCKPNARCIHIATHGEVHNLPLGAKPPPQWVVFHYPGLLFYLQRHHFRAWGSGPSPMPGDGMVLALHTDSGRGSSTPIPFVVADDRVISAVWGKCIHRPTPREVTALWSERAETCFPVWCFSCHGDEEPGPPLQTVLHVDSGRGLKLTMSQVLSAAQKPRVVVLSACFLARVNEDTCRNPLGLLSAFFLRGADYVVAAGRPVADFYMPLFNALFHQAWRASGDPHHALIEAKRQFQCGDWPPATEPLIRGAYRVAMGEILEDIQRDETRAVILVKNVLSWSLPEKAFGELRPLCDAILGRPTHGAEETRSKAILAFQRYCKVNSESLVTQTLDRLVAEGPPREVADCLCTWINGFGQPQPTHNP